MNLPEQRHFTIGYGAPNIREPGQRFAQGFHVPRVAAARGQPSQKPLEIGHSLQRLPKPQPERRVIEQRLDRVEPRANGLGIQQGMEYPMAQLAAAHACPRAIQRGDKGSPARFVAQRLDQLEVALGIAVHHDKARGAVPAG